MMTAEMPEKRYDLLEEEGGAWRMYDTRPHKAGIQGHLRDC